MAENRNQYERLHKINERLNRFANQTAVPKQELIRLCETSERTFKKDLQYMREVYEAPVDWNYKQKGYYYSSPFNLKAELPLSDKDLQNLNVAVQTLTQFKDLPLFAGFKNTVEKIEKAVKFRGPASGRNPQTLLFENVPCFKGAELIEVFLNVIQSANMVRFSHQKFKNETPVVYELEPYVVKEHRNRWYVIGHARNRNGIRCFGLDRILADSIEFTFDHYEPSTFNADDYFCKALGIAVYDEPAQNVIISMTPMRGRFFRTQPFFPFRQEDILIDNEREFRCCLHMIVNKELIYELARFANEMKVIAPKSLKLDLLKHLQESIAFQD